MTRGRAAVGAVLALLVLLVGGLLLQPDAERPGPVAVERVGPARQVDPETGLAWVQLDALPAEVAETLARLDAGGPFPHTRDGAVFGNRERLLPARPSGYYREYTVPTPGSDDRGARRLVAGDQGRQLFYTDDHYASFARVRR